MFTEQDATAQRYTAQVLQGKQSKVQSWPTTEVAETMAVVMGLHFTLEMGWLKVIIEGDCLHVIQSLKSHESSLSHSAIIIDEGRALLPLSLEVKFQHIWRCSNEVAYELASVFFGVGRSRDSLTFTLCVGVFLIMEKGISVFME